ncbi:MAG: HPP family protein [Candidatus Melainabacteria bacterium]
MHYHQPVSKIMKRSKVLDVAETDSVARAIQLLDQCDVSALPVKSAPDHFSGVISKSDIASMKLLKHLQAGRSPAQIRVSEIMNHTPPLYVFDVDAIQKAITLMHQRHIHRLFVADEQYEMIGVISTSDILRMLVVNQ